MQANLEERAYPEALTGCWNWGGTITNKGYAQLFKDGKTYRVSRLMYEEHYGPIPEGMIVRHKCDNPACVNPKHLELGTTQDNVADRVLRKRSARNVGESAGKLAKLTWEKVAYIRSSDKPGNVLAKELNISNTNISKIRLYKAWNPSSKQDSELSLNS